MRFKAGRVGLRLERPAGLRAQLNVGSEALTLWVMGSRGRFQLEGKDLVGSANLTPTLNIST